MYNWSYLKNAALAKLDISEEEANANNLLSRFPIYANEAMTQICSTIKPKPEFAKFTITNEMVGKEQAMPDDFISFGSDICTVSYYDCNGVYCLTESDAKLYPYAIKIENEECSNLDFLYRGYNKIVFKHVGEYLISYNARWMTFSYNIANSTILEVPTDILECIPSYIASQCYKIDDEVKASMYRNEYEMLLARIDDTHFETNTHIKIKGNW